MRSLLATPPAASIGQKVSCQSHASRQAPAYAGNLTEIRQALEAARDLQGFFGANEAKPCVVICGSPDIDKLLAPYFSWKSHDGDCLGARDCVMRVEFRNGPAEFCYISGQALGHVLPAKAFVPRDARRVIAKTAAQLFGQLPGATARFTKNAEIMLRVQARAVPDVDVACLPDLRQASLQEAEAHAAILETWLTKARSACWVVALPPGQRLSQSQILARLLRDRLPRLRIITHPDHVPASTHLLSWYMDAMRASWLPGLAAKLKAQHFAVLKEDEGLGLPLPGCAARAAFLSRVAKDRIVSPAMDFWVSDTITALADRRIDASQDDERLAENLLVLFEELAARIGSKFDENWQRAQLRRVLADDAALTGSSRFEDDARQWTRAASETIAAAVNDAIRSLPYLNALQTPSDFVDLCRPILNVQVQRGADCNLEQSVTLSYHGLTFDCLRCLRRALRAETVYEHFERAAERLFGVEKCAPQRKQLEEQWAELGRCLDAVAKAFQAFGADDSALNELHTLRRANESRWAAL